MSKALEPYLKLMSAKGASDLYFTTGALPSMKIQGKLTPVSQQKLLPGMVKKLAYGILSQKKIEEFEKELEMDIGLGIPDIGRYRINIYMQRGEVSIDGLPRPLGSEHMSTSQEMEIQAEPTEIPSRGPQDSGEGREGHGTSSECPQPFDLPEQPKE